MVNQPVSPPPAVAAIPPSPPPVPNGLWGGSNRLHPSDRLVGTWGVDTTSLPPFRLKIPLFYPTYGQISNLSYGIPGDAEKHPSRYAFLDTQYPYGITDPRNNARLTRSVFAGAGTEGFTSEAALIGRSFVFAYSVCEWLSPCDAVSQLVGSACSISRHGETVLGLCFQSSTGSLECGRTISEGIRPNALRPSYSSEGPMRCPRGTAATAHNPSGVLAKRLMVGGCKIWTDSKYDASAEVHLPQACTVPADYYPGCMNQGAENYDPAARQSATCRYRVSGCLSSTALNYNSEASIDDGSCIEPKWGCTLREEGYSGVDASTPGYKGLMVGVNTAFGAQSSNGPAGGMRPAPFHKSVLNYDAYANAMNGTQSCTIAIEGCMDPKAVNYDSRANINSNTWCVAARRGCMMPSGRNGVAKAGIANPKGKDTAGAANYDPMATVNDKLQCTISRIGCTDPTAANYDIVATIDSGDCLRVWPGCLDKGAFNFNCSSKATTPCTDDQPRVTLHDPNVCVYTPNPLPPPPSPPLPTCGAGCTEVLTVEVSFQAAGTVEQVNRTALQVTFAEQAATVDSFAAGGYEPSTPVAWWQIVVTVTPASVMIIVKIPARDAVAAMDITRALSSVLANASTASAFLGMAVQSTPSIATVVTQYFGPPMPPSAPEHALNILWVQYTMIACAVGLCALCMLARYIQPFICPTRKQAQEMRIRAQQFKEAKAKQQRERTVSKSIVAVVPVSTAPSAKIAPFGAGGGAGTTAIGGAVYSYSSSRMPPGEVSASSSSAGGSSRPDSAGSETNSEAADQFEEEGAGVGASKGGAAAEGGGSEPTRCACWENTPTEAGRSVVGEQTAGQVAP